MRLINGGGARAAMAVVACSFVVSSFGQAGTLDNTFGTGGIVTTDVDAVYNAGTGCVLQPDGRILVVGASYGQDTAVNVLRYEADGTLDPLFGIGGVAVLDFGAAHAQGYSITLQPDGRVVVGAIVRTTNWEFGVARLMSDGTLDTSFDGDGYFVSSLAASYDHLTTVLVQPDGRILLCGLHLQTGTNPWATMRLLSNGALDTTFGAGGLLVEPPDTTTNILVTTMAVQSDGKILLAGRQGGVSNEDFGLTRRNADGSADLSFGTNGWAIWDIAGATDQPSSILVQADGRIVVVGTSISPAPPWSWGMCLVRCNADGSLDPSFGSCGISVTYVADDYVPAVQSALQADGKIIAATHFVDAGNSKTLLRRYMMNGQLDPSFGNGGSVITDPSNGLDWSYGVLVQPDQKIVVAGISYPDALVMRYLNDPDIGVAETGAALFQVSVGPNPTDGSAAVQYVLQRAAKVAMWAFDGRGREVAVFFEGERQGAGLHMKSIDLRAWAAGRYTLVLSVDGQVTSVPLLRQ